MVNVWLTVHPSIPVSLSRSFSPGRTSGAAGIHGSAVRMLTIACISAFLLPCSQRIDRTKGISLADDFNSGACNCASP